jgi:uridylate kinase
MAAKPVYHRVLLKLSGEALAGSRGQGIDAALCAQVAAEIKEVHDAGVQFGIVIGGGNIFRGVSTAANGMSRTSADAIGMLATVINSLAMKEYLIAAGVPAAVMCANAIDKVAEPFTAERAVAQLQAGRVVIIAGGTGNPFFTTDTAAALRCAEIGAEVILKATKVDGVYDSDPEKNPGAKRFDRITHQEALQRNLRVMDATAFSFCMENSLPIIVFKLLQQGNLRKCIEGKPVGTIVTKGA